MAKKGVETVVQFAQTPVLGWQRTTTYSKGKGPKAKQIVEHSAFELRAWELAALAGAGALFYWIFLDKQPSGSSGFSTNPAVWAIGGPVGAWIVGQFAQLGNSPPTGESTNWATVGSFTRAHGFPQA